MNKRTGFVLIILTTILAACTAQAAPVPTSPAAYTDRASHGRAHGDSDALVPRCAGVEGYRVLGLHPGGGRCAGGDGDSVEFVGDARRGFEHPKF